MRVLLLGSDSPLGRALNSFLAETGRHEVTGVSWSATRWKSERQAKKAIRRANPELVVDTRMEAVADGGQEIGELDIKRSHWVAKCCHRDNAVHFFVSSARDRRSRTKQGSYMSRARGAWRSNEAANGSQISMWTRSSA